MIAETKIFDWSVLYMQKFTKVSSEDVKKVFGKSSILWLITNSYHDVGKTSDYANIYQFTKKDFEKNPDLCALIYGRVNSKGVFKSCKVVTNSLANSFIKYAIDCISIADLQTYASDNGYTNLGVAVEYYLVEKFNGKHGTEKQDKLLKQDVLINGHFIQIKCSLATDKTNLSYSTTNDRI